jgi:membrane fusion protein (multidrug efflux system)
VRSAARRHFFLFAAVAVLAIMLVAAIVRLSAPTSAAQNSHGAGRMTQVTAVTSQMREFADNIEALGVAKGVQSANLSSNNTEVVQAVRFREGAFVHRGDVLVLLKATEQQADITTQRAALAVAQSNYDRYNQLAQAGFLAPAAMEQYRAALEQARADLRAAQSRESDRVIRAPFDGRVGISDIAPGALINPGSTIVTIDDVSLVRVDFDVPDRYLPALRVGAAITARPDPYPARSVTGRIAQIDTRIDPNTHAIRARAEFANPDGTLLPGMLMHVTIENGQRQAVSVPEAAVQSDSDQSYVYEIVRQGERTLARQVAVEVGVNQNGVVEIRRGLAVNTRVVANGLDRIEPNAPVQVVQSRAAEAAVSGLRLRSR